MTRKLARWMLFTIVFCGGMLALADGWRSPLYVGYAIGISAVFCYALLALSPELAKERFHPPEKGIDWTALFWVRLMALATVVGYAGMIAGVPLMAIGLGSWVGFAFASAYSLLILRRVAYEDRFLQ